MCHSCVIDFNFIKLISNCIIVSQVLIKNNIAVGVEFDFRDDTFQVKAKKEVSLSAGAIKTPQLLMLSGIGPKVVLEKLNVSIEYHIFASLMFTKKRNKEKNFK